MRAFIQRVQQAKVTVEHEVISQIPNGLLVLVGFMPEDKEEDYQWIVNKLKNLRLFNDSNSVMNLSLEDIKGELLIVSQFTLYAQTKKGNRPSYIKASKPEIAKQQYQNFLSYCKLAHPKVETGIFGANMNVELINDGPVTILLDSKQRDI